MIIVCRLFADGRLRFWKAGCLGHEDTICGVEFALCDCVCGMAVEVRGEREELDEG